MDELSLYWWYFLSKVVQVNENYLKLKAGYLFPEIAKRVKIFSQSNNNSDIIKLGIGDVTEPLPKACRNAMAQALMEVMFKLRDDHSYEFNFKYFESRLKLYR